MFRKRKKSSLEKSLEEVGVDLSNPLGKYLLNRLIKFGHSEILAHINKEDIDGRTVYVRDLFNHHIIAGVQLLLEDNIWYLSVWNNDRNDPNGKFYRVYSEYDLFGNRVNNV